MVFPNSCSFLSTGCQKLVWKGEEFTGQPFALFQMNDVNDHFSCFLFWKLVLLSCWCSTGNMVAWGLRPRPFVLVSKVAGCSMPNLCGPLRLGGLKWIGVTRPQGFLQPHLPVASWLRNGLQGHSCFSPEPSTFLGLTTLSRDCSRQIFPQCNFPFRELFSIKDHRR